MASPCLSAVNQKVIRSSPVWGANCFCSSSPLPNRFLYGQLKTFSSSPPLDRWPHQGLEPTSESRSTSVRSVRNADRHPSGSAGDRTPSGPDRHFGVRGAFLESVSALPSVRVRSPLVKLGELEVYS